MRADDQEDQPTKKSKKTSEGVAGATAGSAVGGHLGKVAGMVLGKGNRSAVKAGGIAGAALGGMAGDEAEDFFKGKKDKVDNVAKEAAEKPSKGLSKAKKSAVVKKAKAGGDIGKPGKGFEKVEKAAAKGGAKDPKAVAAAAMWKNIKRESQQNFRSHVRVVNESLALLIRENEEEKAKAITAASDIVNDFTSWMQRVGQYQTKAVIELADSIKADFGAAEAEQFKQSVAPALAATLETLTSQREIISQAVAVLAGEAAPSTPMGSEEPTGPVEPVEPGMEPAEPDALNAEPAGDEFGAADAASGSREVRESKFVQKLAESHSIIAKLAR